MSKQEETIEIAGKKVVVRYARAQEDACASCAFCSRKECHDLDCNMRDRESVCKYAYFVEAEQQTPSDIKQEAARKYADEQLAGHNRELAESGHTRHFKMGYVCFAGYEIEQAFVDGAEWQSVKDGECHEESFEEGAKWQRERMMKEAPVADVIEMHGSTETGHPLVLTLGFPKLPNIEYRGGKVRVIIEEIK